jgi:signal transduction histidine kinase
MFKSSEDLTFNRQLQEISGVAVKHYNKYGVLPDYLPIHVSAYADIALVPKRLQRYVENHSQGIFEINEEALNYHAAICPLASGGKLYFFYNVDSLETDERFQMNITAVLIGISALILFIGWLLARLVSRQIVFPITRLANQVQDLSFVPGKLSTNMELHGTPDEIGVLARTIEELLERIHRFTKREREFTAHASHELRTPVTVIKGAVELLKCANCGQEKSCKRPLARIEHAVQDTEMLINTFLMLARGDSAQQGMELCQVDLLVEQIVDNLRPLLKGKPVEVDVCSTFQKPLLLPLPLATIGITNLARNAFQYTMEGMIEIIVDNDRVTVTDSGPGMERKKKGNGNSNSNGLGLVIVERICEKTGWQCLVDSNYSNGTRVELIFSQKKSG